VCAVATLTELEAWCYDLDLEKVAVRRNNLVRSASVVLLRLRSNQHGAIQLEYTILLGLVGLSSAAAFVLLGVALVDSFGFVRGMLLTPFP
jgi:Flp pilus assembly pilin Flp